MGGRGCEFDPLRDIEDQHDRELIAEIDKTLGVLNEDGRRLWLGDCDDTAKQFSFPNPNCEETLEAMHTLRYGTPTKDQIYRVLEMAEAYSSLTTYPLGVEHCIGNLRAIHKRLRAHKRRERAHTERADDGC